MTGIVYPELCHSPPCKLEGKVKKILFATLSSFSFDIVLVMLMATMYWRKCGPGQRKITLTKPHIRLIKLAVLMFDVLARSMNIYFIFDLIQASSSLENAGCIDIISETAHNIFDWQVYELASLPLAILWTVNSPVLHITAEEITRRVIAEAKFSYKKLVEIDPNDEMNDIEIDFFPVVRFIYFVFLNSLVCVDLILMVCALWILFAAVMNVQSALISAKTQSGSDWCLHCSDWLHRDDIGEYTGATDMIILRSIVSILGLSIAASFIIFTVVIAKRLAHAARMHKAM